LPRSLGVHHVCAITTNAQRNLDFYVGFLGLRLVTQTVNFDDPDIFHLFYGDQTGSPGSIMTFFVWPGSNQGQQGASQVAITSFAIHPTSLAFWIDRLLQRGVPFAGPVQRPSSSSGTESVLSFHDPDGLMLELVTHAGARTRPTWRGVPDVPEEHAIHGFHSVTLWVSDSTAAERILTGELGFHSHLKNGATERFILASGEPANIVNVRTVGSFVQGTEGGGTVHHVAWSVPDEADFGPIREHLSGLGFAVSATIDRRYFKACCLREKGGILHELSTTAPGFTADESVEHLGERLMIPVELEHRREEIERRLPPLRPTPSASPESWFATPPESSRALETKLAFRHRYLSEREGPGRTLLLLHGTGGDENSLVELGSSLAPGAALLRLRGNVREGQSNRFFRRHPEGILDQEDLELRTAELAGFLRQAQKYYAFDLTEMIAVGFSNGANILASLLFRYPGLVRGAILLSPMMPFEPESSLNLTGTSVFIGAGRNDPLVPAGSVERLVKALHEAGANVGVYRTDEAHRITAMEVEAATSWLDELKLQGGTGVF